MTKFFRQNRTEVLLILAILIFAAFLRFYRLPEYMMFLGDQGRDALMIKRILADHHPTLIGPATSVASSVGNVYLGPLYYYMMAMPMAIWWLNPVSAAGMVALIGVATVGLIYYLARVWWGVWPAVAAATLYAVSPVNIIYSRFSWNPNPAPFFALLALFSFCRARYTQNYWWLVLTGGAVAAAIQMHYLALILLPVFGVLWLYQLMIAKKSPNFGLFIKGSAAGVVLFLVMMSPLLMFDIRHNFINFQAAQAMFTERGASVDTNVFGGLEKLLPIYKDKLISRYMAGEEQIVAVAVAGVLIAGLGWVFYRRRTLVKWPYFALGVWLFGGILGLTLYRQEIIDHYLGFLNPAPYLLLGGFIALLKRPYQMWAAVAFIVILGGVNLLDSPLNTKPNDQLGKTQEIAKYIVEQAKGKSLNFALIADNNYDDAYEFYLEQYGSKPKDVVLDGKTDQLFVVCEDKVCQPVGHSKHEIAAFGWTKIEKEESVAGIRVFKLVRHEGDPSLNR